MMRNVATIIAVCCALWLGACNTMEGLGKDVKKTGEKLEDAAARKK